MVSDLGYINARIRAMRSYLLKKDDYEEILEKGNFDNFFIYFESLPSYRDDLREMSREYGRKKEAVDFALKKNLENNFRKIINFSGGRPKDLILLILNRYDISNLKTVLRGIFYNINEDKRFKAIVCAGEWEDSFCKNLCRVNSLKGVIAILSKDKSPFSQEVSSILARYEKEELNKLEDKLDSFYFHYCLSHLEKDKSEDSQILEFLQSEIDFKNILLILKSFHRHSGIEKVDLMGGGKIPIDFIFDLLRYKDMRKILEILAKFYYLEISEELLSFLGEDKILNLEKFFLKQLLFLAVRLYSKSLLSIGVVLGYLQMKEAEIINLRTLSFGLYHGLPTGLLKEQLILSYS